MYAVAYVELIALFVTWLWNGRIALMYRAKSVVL